MKKLAVILLFLGCAALVGCVGFGSANPKSGQNSGGVLGENMDDSDRLKMSQSLESSALGQQAVWQNETNGITYTVTPVKNVSLDGNPYCRDYRGLINIDGQRQPIFGTACREPNGFWKNIE